jgi:pyridinium-3,5-biscarboxylic acid mononucleotide sulfurtransferase
MHHHDLLDRARAGPAASDPVALARFGRLLEIVDELGSCVLALSGGIDSSFLLAVTSRLLGERCLALTGDSAAVPAWDRADAAAAAVEANRHGARRRTVATKELDDPRYAGNPRSRCYFCKMELFGVATAIARSEGYAWVVDGTNASDTARHDRPGMSAASELGVRSPLAEAGITKEQLRLLARSIGVEGWDRPASACLASRIPFGEAITAERLRRVESAELALRALGFRQVRVRDFGRAARVEVEADELIDLRRRAADVRSRLLEAGFESWTPAAYTGNGAGDSAA